MTEPSQRPRSRRMLLILLAVFMLPVATSFLLYYTGWRPAGSTNHGELLQPIHKLPPGFESLEGKWALMYVGDGACDQDCRTALVFARQTRLSLAKDTSRVNRVLVATDRCCDLAYLEAEHRGALHMDLSDAGRRAQLLSLLPQDLAHSLLIVDPLGNIVMRYDVRQSPRGLLDDMKKLLKLSHIG
jgi:hypothetical protein